MPYETVLFNLHQLSQEESARYRGHHRDEVLVANADLARRVHRLTTASGRDVALRLPAGSPPLRPGDVIGILDDTLLVIGTGATDVLVAEPQDLLQMGRVAHALGNRHLPVQFHGPDDRFGRAVLVCSYDRTVEAQLDALGCKYSRTSLVLDEPLRHAEHRH